MTSKPDLDCYVLEGWNPRIRPAARQRRWMDDSPEAFAYRCLPLTIANTHGWEIVCDTGFSARWNGGMRTADIEISLEAGHDPVSAPVSLFGQGVITFHIAGLFQTSQGWNLWVGGPPNDPREGIVPLTGIIETDWSPYSFTMNWRFTRPDHWVRFEAGDAICCFFSVERGVVDRVTPRLRPMAASPELDRQFREWSRSRNEFHEAVGANPPRRPADKWQKLYYRGLRPDNTPGPGDHQSKVSPQAFFPGASTPRPGCPAGVFGPPAFSAGERATRRHYALRQLSPRLRGIPRSRAITREQFLDAHYAANWPLLLCLPARPDSWAAEMLPAAGAGEGFRVMQPPAGLASAGLIREISGMAAPSHLLAGAAGAFAPLTEEPVNRLIHMVAGRLRVILVHPAAAPALQPRAHTGTAFDLTLEPGDILFVPIGWWAQSRALEPFVSAVHDQFPWPQEGTV